ncbi:MAG: hypothetical protein WBY47_08945 [Desulfobacterales bacterium]|jgi:hypothetical protein
MPGPFFMDTHRSKRLEYLVEMDTVEIFFTQTAQTYDVIDPVTLLARLRGFSQPSETQEPIELLREGIKFHARGLINTKSIQHNLDWIWPYWVEKQYNPGDSFFRMDVGAIGSMVADYPFNGCRPVRSVLLKPCHFCWRIAFIPEVFFKI